MPPKSPELIYGAAALWTATDQETSATLDLLEELGIGKVDSAEMYGSSEELLGRAHAAVRFDVSTKLSTAMAGAEQATPDVIVRHAQESLRKLQTKAVSSFQADPSSGEAEADEKPNQVDVYYLHAPDRNADLKDTLLGIDQVYKQGTFKRFGLSNFLPREVEDVIRICKQHNFVLPSVFQGNYSPVARRPDAELIPILRKHGIAFYAYSPLAGGFLTKTREILTGGGGKGRWDPTSDLGKLYGGLYNKPRHLDALDTWGGIAEDEGVSKAELAYRWIAHNSRLRAELGDGVIFGAYNAQHLKETVMWLREGPVSESAAKRIDEMWEGVKHEAVWDNFNDFIQEKSQQK